MGLRVLASQTLTTNGTVNTNTTTALTMTVPVVKDVSGNTPEAGGGYLPTGRRLRLQANDTPMHVQMSATPATAADMIVSPNNPTFFYYADKSQVPASISTFCEGGTSKLLNVAWVDGDEE